MPSQRVSAKDQARSELARRLRLPLADILDRDGAADFLGWKNKTSLSNLGAAGPGYYKAPIGRNGYTLYRRDWLKAYDGGKTFVAGQQAWPPALYSGPRANSEEFLDKHVDDDEGYKQKVMTGWE